MEVVRRCQIFKSFNKNKTNVTMQTYNIYVCSTLLLSVCPESRNDMSVTNAVRDVSLKV